MGLAVKQITKQLGKNKIFVILMWLLMTLTSLSFFFVRFSIDSNMEELLKLNVLSENQQLYKNALTSNSSLAYIGLQALGGLTAFVIIMFFYRFIKTNRKMIGCLKALGFRDRTLRVMFMMFISVISLLGVLLGMAGGYFLSSVLIEANMQTYSVSGLTKGVSIPSVLAGLGLPTLVYTAAAFFAYAFISGTETGILLDGGSRSEHSRMLLAADRAVNCIPVKNKSALRISLRKPLAILLLCIAVMSCSVCILLGYSLNISNKQVFDSQMDGREFEFDARFTSILSHAQDVQDAAPYLKIMGTANIGSGSIELNVAALYKTAPIYRLQDIEGEAVNLPESGEVVIGPGLPEIYGLRMGDTMTVTIDSKSVKLKICAVAANAESDTVYINAEQMTQMLGLQTGDYNGGFYKTSQKDLLEGMDIVTKEQHIEELNRNATSNKISAVINHIIGALAGCILIFLALYVNFQDNTRDILILHMMGYPIKKIRKMLIDIYRPMICCIFVITLLPSIWMVKSIQKSLSITTGDYMPFGTNAAVILMTFVILNVIYWLVQTVFSAGIKRIIRKTDLVQYADTE